MAPVGQLSRQPARAQCLHTSDENSHENPSAIWFESATGRSMKATCLHVDAPSATVLSYDMPVRAMPSSGNWFHCLHATSQALQPMQMVVSVKKPFPAILNVALLAFFSLEAVLRFRLPA